MHGKGNQRGRSFSTAGLPLAQVRLHIEANLAALQSAIQQSQGTIEEARQALRNADRVLRGTPARHPLGPHARGTGVANAHAASRQNGGGAS
jgi:hypothetical protein